MIKNIAMNTIYLIIWMMSSGISMNYANNIVQDNIDKYTIVSDKKTCSFNEGRYANRNVVILVKPIDFNKQYLETLVRNLSVKYDRIEELRIKIETNEEAIRKLLGSYPGYTDSRSTIGSISDNNKDTRLHAFYYRYKDNEILRYTNTNSNKYEKVILKGVDLLCPDTFGLSYEIIDNSFVFAEEEVCVRRDIVILMKESEFNEESLKKMFYYIKDLFPWPKRINVQVFTNPAQLTEHNINIESDELNLLGFNTFTKSDDGRYRSASFSIAPDESYIHYTLYPFKVNKYGGIETKRIEIITEGK